MSDRKSIESLPSVQPIQTALLTWYREHQRPLPWRTEVSLYRTVVSELMCQQTQIDTVLPYFERWMKRFPDFASLAEADEAVVLKHWEGLGYYSRARNLHKLAKAVASMPQPPRTPEDWKQLPGIGPYTAAAITSIVFHYPAAVVDGNVIRVLARLTAESREFNGNEAAAKWFRPIADSLLNRSAPGDHNQGMMELGATVCLKSRPSCLVCPIREHCRSAGGDVSTIPRILRKATEKIEKNRAWILNGDRLLLHRAGTSAKRLANMVELPLAEAVVEQLPATPLAIKSRGISNQRISERIFQIPFTDRIGQQVSRNPELFFHPISRLDEITLSGPHRKWIEELLKTYSD